MQYRSKPRGAADASPQHRSTQGSATMRAWRASAMLLLAALAIASSGAHPAHAASAQAIDRDADAALAKLYADSAAARMLRDKAKGILVFPSMLKAGFMFGGQIGEGALRRGGKTVAYYNSVAASYGFQAGAQKFGYALFFLTDSALAHLDRSGGFELGAGPSLVVVDAGFAKSMTTATLTQEIYAFVFDQKGIMGGVGIQGSKITRVSK
jgi:lipid-binding SYLF domain-containing protein